MALPISCRQAEPSGPPPTEPSGQSAPPPEQSAPPEQPPTPPEAEAELPPPPPQEPETPPEPVPEQPSENTRLYILMYHQLVLEGQPCNTWAVTDVRFREDLEWLAGSGWTTVLPSELAGEGPLPDKAVMITFDDGYCSNYWVAYPLLQEYQAKAVISVIAGLIDREEPYFLTWTMCRIMVQSGLVEIGSHSYDLHSSDCRGLRRLQGECQADYEARVFPDLQSGIDRIEANVGVRPTLFAYPFGKTEPWATGFIREHFSASVTTRCGSADTAQGPYGMNRYTVTMDTPLRDILPK